MTPLSKSRILIAKAKVQKYQDQLKEDLSDNLYNALVSEIEDLQASISNAESLVLKLTDEKNE